MIFSGNQNNTILEPFLAFFAQIWAKWIFLEKRALSVVKYSNYLPSCQKSEKLMSYSREKCHIDGQTHQQTDGQTDRQVENSDFIAPSAWRRSKIVPMK